MAVTAERRRITYNRVLVSTNKVGKGIMVVTPRTPCEPLKRIAAAASCA
jgi:hypothetical protein